MKITLFIITSLILSSCASILNKRYQTVNITTDSDSSRVYINNEFIGTGKRVAFKARRNLFGYQLRIEQEGKYPRYKGVVQTKKSPLYYMSIVPFGPLLIPPAFDVMRKSFDYPKEIYVKPGVNKLKRTADFKSMIVENVLSNLESAPNLIIKYKKYVPDQFPLKTKKLNVNINFFTYNYPWKKELNRVLEEANYLDTININKKNRLYLTAKLKTIHNLYIYKAFAGSYRTPGCFVSHAIVDWEVKDDSGKILFTKTIESFSGEHLMNIFANSISANFMDAYNESLSYNMIQLVHEIEQGEFIQIQKTE